MHCLLMLKLQGVHEWNHTLSFPEFSVGVAYFLNLVWLLIDCNLLSHCLLKIIFCQIISMLANNLRERPSRSLLEHLSHHPDLACIPGLQEVHPWTRHSLSMEDSHQAPGTLLRNTCLFFFLVFFYFSLSEMNTPACTLSRLYPWGIPFTSFAFPCSYFHYRRR